MSEEVPRKTRGKRGGKRAAKQAILQERFLRGEFIPKTFRNSPPFAPGVESPVNDPKAGSIIGIQHPPPRPVDSEPVVSYSSVPIPKATSIVSSSSVSFPKAGKQLLSSSGPTPVVPVSIPKTPPKGSAFGDLASGSSSSKGFASSKDFSQPVSTVLPASGSPQSGHPQKKAKFEGVQLSAQVSPGKNPPIRRTSVDTGLANTVRVSLDFHNVLDCEYAGAETFEGIRTSAFNVIEAYLQLSTSHRVGICSYIGTKGRDSWNKRAALEKAVQEANQKLLALGIPDFQLIELCITPTPNKPEITTDSCDIHLDDKTSVIEAVSTRGVPCVQFVPFWVRNRRTATTLQEFFDGVRVLVPRVHAKQFYQ